MEQAERYAWLCLNFLPYVGAESFLQLIRRFGTAENAWQQPLDEVADGLPRKQARDAWTRRRGDAERAADAALKWEMQDGCRLLLLADRDFPPMLAEGLTPPPVLFVRGRTDLLACPSVSIVGSRHATPQAARIARDFGQALSEKGVTVVSGMASGIDTAAHQGALNGSGSTVAVWGTGIDRIYPPSNRDLAYQIAENGAVVSEFPLGTRPLAGNFPRRNRLIAALSQATLVVEAAVESGSLITARLAGEMGREVMAVPGSIDNPHSKGCHKLIKDGAKLTECLDDIFNECPQLLHKPPHKAYSINKEEAVCTAAPLPQTVETPSEKLPDERSDGLQGEVSANAGKLQTAEGPADEAQRLLSAMGYDAVHPDMLAETLNLPAADIYAVLLEMELDGKVAQAGGGRYQRIA